MEDSLRSILIRQTLFSKRDKNVNLVFMLKENAYDRLGMRDC